MKRISLLIFLNLIALVTDGQDYLNLDALKSPIFANFELINTKFNEFSAAIAEEKVYFISDATSNGKELGSFDVFSFNQKDVEIKRAKLSSKLSSRYQEGPVSSMKGRNKIVFSRSSVLDSNGMNLSRLFIYDFTYDNIQNINLPIGKSENICHPTLNSKQTHLICVSDGKKGLDLVSTQTKASIWQPFEYLNSLNSPYNDVFPNFITDKIIIFASDRPGGYGGLDLYISQFVDGTWGRPLLLPPPFNSERDDFGLVLDNVKFRKGYLSSNRSTGLGGDDIYSFSLSMPLVSSVKPEIIYPLDILTLNKLGFDAVVGVSIRLYVLDDTASINLIKRSNLNVFNTTNVKSIQEIIPSLGAKATSYTSNGQGLVHTKVKAGNSVLIESIMEGYQNQIIFLEKIDSLQSQLSLALTPIVTNSDEESNEGLKNGDIFTFKTEFFKSNSSSLGLGLFEDLDLLAKELIGNEAFKIILVNHTDARGTALLNKKLSLDRAIALKQYLIKQGIAPERIDARGAGDTEIINECKNGVKCSEDNHSFNVRTVITVTQN
jgi:outer membrane protein OmpA-like peptidoglycan-associated protein